MNGVRQINRINERELALGGDGTTASWHDDYKDSAYVFVGGLAYELTEGDVITIMSQFGEVADINMPRDAETGKPKGFAFVMYEDQRSTVLAVDNLTGGTVLGRTLRVDHVKDYKQPGTRNEEGDFQEPDQPSMNALPPIIGGSDASTDSSDLQEEDEDPMAAYIRAERKKAKSQKKKKRKADGGETKEERRARRALKKVKKERGGGREDAAGRVKREEEGSPRRQEHRDRSRSPHHRRPRSPSRSVKRETSQEDIKPSRDDLSRRGKDINRTPPSPPPPPPSARVKREPSPPAYEAPRYHASDPRAAEYPSRRGHDHWNRDAASRGHREPHRSARPGRDDHRRTETDWPAGGGGGRREDDSHPHRGGGGREEGDYASWQSRREVERVMRRVGGGREERSRRGD